MSLWVGKDIMVVNGYKKKISLPTMEVIYTSSEKTVILVPLKEVCQGLGFKTTWDSDKLIFGIQKQTVKFSGARTTTLYGTSMKGYGKREYERTPRISKSAYLKLIDVKTDETHRFQYLVIGSYRSVNKKKFGKLYNYLIKDYCDEMNISYKKSVLYGK